MSTLISGSALHVSDSLRASLPRRVDDVSSVGAALIACREARFSDALDILREDGGPPAEPAAFLLYVRVILRTNPIEAIATLARNIEALGPPHRYEAALLLGTAQARVGDYKSAHVGFERVREALRTLSDADCSLTDELQYREVLAFWMERKLVPAETALKTLLENPASKFYVEALILSGAVSAARGRLEQQAATLLKALRAVLEKKERDVLHWAHVTAQVSYLAREMPNPSLRAAAIENVDAVPWTPDVADLHFTTLKAIGWRYALEGDYLAAFRCLKRARRVAPSEAWQVMAMCDRALLAQSLGERRFTEQELDDISEIADRIEWRAISGEERHALLLLAVLYAPTDGALALSYIAKFQETGNRFDALLSANDDRRLKALVDYSLGFVYARLNYRDDALVFLQDAWNTFNEIGYDWRAARCAKEIAGFTHDAHWASLASDKIRAYPRSWIAAEIALPERDRSETATAHEGRDAVLTPAQREVYRLLMEGVAVAEIAQVSGRSEFTVRNHIKAIFKAFHVNSRAALMRSSPQRVSK